MKKRYLIRFPKKVKGDVYQFMAHDDEEASDIICGMLETDEEVETLTREQYLEQEADSRRKEVA